MTKQGLSAIVSTTGNDACHVILRGSNRGPNYDAASIAEVAKSLEEHGLVDRVMIDCSHGNSRKDFNLQAEVAAGVGEQVAAGSTSIFGVMLESHLVEGRQDLGDGTSLRFGQSVTDACMSWETTVPVLENLAEAARKRRASASAPTAKKATAKKATAKRA